MSGDIQAAAIVYAIRDGWHVVPLVGKNPGVILGERWERQASCDPDVVGGWDWARATGVGVYLPASGLVCSDLDDLAREARMLELGVRFDAGLVARSGRGGLHAYYPRPAGITAEQWGNPRIHGVEFRANGHQVLPPSQHPNGNQYEWVHQDAELPTLPPQIVKARRNGSRHVDHSRHVHLLKVAKRAVSQEIRRLDTSDGRVFPASEMDGLAKAGVEYASSPSPSPSPVRPPLSPSVRPLPSGGDGHDESVPKSVPNPHSWVSVDIVAHASHPPAPPELIDLFYPGYNHLISGESEALKTWLALAAAAEELAAGRGVLWVDGDDVGSGAILERLRLLGATDDAIATRFAYMSPDEPIDGDRRGDVLDVVTSRSCRLCVLDGFNPLLTLHGFDPDRGTDVENFYRLFDPIRKAPTAVLLPDNVVKTKEARGKWAIGSERKKSKAEVHLGMVTLVPLVRGGTGRARIDVHKDRPGHLTRPSPGVFEVSSTTGGCAWRIRAEESRTAAGAFRPTTLMERVSRYLELHPEPQTRTRIEDNVSGKGEFVRAAIDRLVEEGYATEFDGPNRSRPVQLEQAFREDGEPT